MQSLKEIHDRLEQKKKESSEIKKMFKESLEHNETYQALLEKLKVMKEEKKSIENEAWRQSSRDADRLDLLKLDIKSDKEVLSDIALNMYVAGKTVEIVDEEKQARWVPQFSVRFKKEETEGEEKPKVTAADVSFADGS
jgi:hypothetical protein